jgi:putative two-component system response regulator
MSLRETAGQIVVVDDDPLTSRLLVRIVQAEGFEAEAAGTIAEAQGRISALRPDLVLLDVNLPDGSGLSLARRLAGDLSGPAVVMVSGQNDAEVAAIALQSGAYGYLTKPFKQNEVAIAVRDALRRRVRERADEANRTILEDHVVERSAAVQQAVAAVQHAHEETVRRLSKAIEYREPDSARHIDRMSRYCGLLAPMFDLDPDVVRAASRLHDIGKIGVPDAILQKPGVLTAEERATMQAHAETGHRLLRGSGIELLDVAATIAWTHHERYDGRGYPRGLAGDAIPAVGRVAAVADVFDALMTNRPHRPARSVDEARATIAAERGRHFDPAVVDAFLERGDEVSRIISEFEEPAGAPAAEAAGAVPDLVSLQEAATAVGVSTSTLRRWADEGRIGAVRPAGGHRRFPLDAVRRLAAGRGTGTVVRPVEPPAMAVAALAELLRTRGSELVAAAAASLYRGGAAGGFAREDAARPFGDWIAELARGGESGHYGAALEATDLFMRRASLQGTPLLERHRFLERLGDTVGRALAQQGVSQDDLAATRRLFAALQQAQLDGRS